jgi:hypothetical protein
MLGKNLQDILFKLEPFLQYGNRITRNGNILNKYISQKAKFIENHGTKHQVNQSVKFHPMSIKQIMKKRELNIYQD